MSNSVSFALDPVPATTQAGRNVRRLRISFSGNKRPAVISIAGTTCTTCSVVLAVPPRVKVFTVDAFDDHGHRLSHSSIMPDLSGGPLAHLSLASTVASVSIGVASQPVFGTKSATTLYVSGITGQPYESIIVGPGAYSQPIALALSTQLSGMRLSKTTLKGAADTPATLRYGGGAASAFVTARSAGSSAGALVVPNVPVSKITLDAIPVQGGIAVAGDYLWANLRGSIERVDIHGGGKRVTPLPAGDDIPGPLTGTADGSLWYAGCELSQASFATAGVGFISAAGAVTFYATDSMPALTCATLAMAPSGAIWFTGGTDFTMMSAPGVFTTIDVKPPRTIRSQLSDIVFVDDGTMWMIGSYPSNAGSLVHVDVSGSVLAAYGKRKYVSVVTDGRKRIFAIGPQSIAVYDLSGTLQEKYTPPNVSGGQIQTQALAVTPDGSLWFGLASDQVAGTSLFGRIAPDGSLWEFSVPGGSGITALAASADGFVWFLEPNSANVYRINV